jgi:DNA modification methylase
MKQIPSGSIAAIVTDPPFAFAGGLSNGMSSSVDSQFFSHWWRAVCDELARILAPDADGFIWCDWRTAPIIAAGFAPRKQTYDFFKLSQMLFHYREMPGMGRPFRSSVDMIAYIKGPKSKSSRIPATTHNFVSKYWYYGKHEHHPAEKDVEICKTLLGWCSDAGQLVIDPFAGSGTAAIAAHELGRCFIAIELEQVHFLTACRRLDKHGAQYTKETCQTSTNTPMAGGVPPQICEAQTSP